MSNRTTASHDSEAGSLDIYARYGPTTRRTPGEVAGENVLSLRGPLWRGAAGITLAHHIMRAVSEAERIAYEQGKADMASEVRTVLGRAGFR